MVRVLERGHLSADSQWWVALLGLVVAALAAHAILARRWAGPRDPGASVWELVPSWQYEGRRVESGGLTRDEQERAIEELREQVRWREGT